MALVDLKFFKQDNTPWGFRLTGGSDFEVPLQVVKVSNGSIAEKAGMQLGDLIVQINNVEAASLTHIEAHDVILNAGNDFTIKVIRGELPQELQEQSSININISNKEHEKQEICIESMESEVREHETESYQISGKLQTEIELSVQIREEEYITEEEMQEESSQERISAQAKVLSEKVSEEKLSEKVVSEENSVIAEGMRSVDFQQFMPSVIKDSEVLKVLNESKSGTKDDKRTQEKKWSTFLQKPKIPVPVDKKREAERSKESPYRVVIVKGKKKDPNAQPASQGSTPSVDSQATPIPEPVQDDQQQEEEIPEQDVEKEELEIEPEPEPEEELIDTDAVVETELSLEEQLAAVQRQLLALSQLPAAIQQTLDVVTSQLAKIVGPVPGSEQDQNEQEEVTGNMDEENDYQQDDFENELDILAEIPEEGESDQDAYQTEENLRDQDIEDGRQERVEEESQPEPEREPTPEPELTPEEKEARRIEQEKEDKKLKEHMLLEDLRQRRIKERPSYPLTPLQRPIFLPGGRRWKMPDDACPEIVNPGMSDDLIAETISSQSEIITGTTLGYDIWLKCVLTDGSFQIVHWNRIWPWGDHLGRRIYRDCNCEFVPSKAIETKKINFLKYQPLPVALDHLKNSEVYRLVHDLEPAPRGVGARSGKALAEEDYYTQIRKEDPQQRNDALNK